MIKKYPATLRKSTLLCSFFLMTIFAQAQMELNKVENVMDSKEIVITKPVRTTNTAPIIFRDNGTGTLINGTAEIEIGPEIATLLEGEKIEEMVQLSVQMEGESKGIYISKKNRNTFIITELENGVSNTAFTYKISLQAAE
ncbi:MAG: hypothetical protein AAF489_16440 [Bacteroidota bacterium]